MADVERESNNSDQKYNKLIHQKKTTRIESEKKFAKLIVRNVRGEGVQLPPLLVVVLLRLAQVATRGVRVKRKKNAGKRHEAFLGKVKKLTNKRK